jgi:hypothetical protein
MEQGASQAGRTLAVRACFERGPTGTASWPTPEEREEMRHYEYAEHLVRLAKGRAPAKLNRRTG